jgi:uncharacterized repeat protein (TIGR03803 family)
VFRFASFSLLLAASGLTLTGFCSGQAAPQFKLLHNFGGKGDGVAPTAGVVFDSEGNLYGTTNAGGDYDYGTVYELTPERDGSWSEAVLHSFPYHSNQDGQGPVGGVSVDSVGSLYGTTALGGANAGGTVFELTPGNGGWTETIFYNFCSLPNCDDGFSPINAPVLDPAGNLYGGTSSGTDQGVVYELTPTSSGWNESILYTFCSRPQCLDGRTPGEIVRDAAGNLYGPTEEGGPLTYLTELGERIIGNGEVFSLTPPKAPGGTWQETVLHSFVNRTDGGDPTAVTLHGHALYGTTLSGGGGPPECNGGCGTVFQLVPNGVGSLPTETILHAFTDFAGGVFPVGGLAFDRTGNIYGVTSFGGAACGCGVVYELRRGRAGTWHYEVLHEFTGGDGVQPIAGLTIDSEGNLYGTTNGGGGGGVVFEILMPNGTK